MEVLTSKQIQEKVEEVNLRILELKEYQKKLSLIRDKSPVGIDDKDVINICQDFISEYFSNYLKFYVEIKRFYNGKCDADGYVFSFELKSKFKLNIDHLLDFVSINTFGKYHCFRILKVKSSTNSYGECDKYHVIRNNKTKTENFLMGTNHFTDIGEDTINDFTYNSSQKYKI